MPIETHDVHNRGLVCVQYLHTVNVHINNPYLDDDIQLDRRRLVGGRISDLETEEILARLATFVLYITKTIERFDSSHVSVDFENKKKYKNTTCQISRTVLHVAQLFLQ